MVLATDSARGFPELVICFYGSPFLSAGRPFIQDTAVIVCLPM